MSDQDKSDDKPKPPTGTVDAVAMAIKHAYLHGGAGLHVIPLPGHPAPWRWEAIAQEQHEGSILRDANGADILSAGADDAYGQGWSAGSVTPSPLARELIRLAPELEAVLRKVEWFALSQGPLSVLSREDCLACPECDGAKVDGHERGCQIAALLAVLDTARRAP